MPTRLYWRDTLIGNDGFPIWELSETMGTAATTQVNTANTDVYENNGAWRAAVGADIDGDSFPTSFVILARGNSAVRIRVERRNSAGTVLAASDWGTERITVGTHVETFTMATTWAPGDVLAVQMQGRRAPGTHGGSTADIGANREGSFVDATFTVTDPVNVPVPVAGLGVAAFAPALGLTTNALLAVPSASASLASFPPSVVALGSVGWPSADITVGDWTVAPLYSKVNTDVSPDTEFITSGAAACELLMQPVLPPNGGDVVFMIRARRTVGSAANLEVRVVEGATVRAMRTLEGLTETFADYLVTLTSVEADSVTDWGDVRVRFTRVE